MFAITYESCVMCQLDLVWGMVLYSTLHYTLKDVYFTQYTGGDIQLSLCFNLFPLQKVSAHLSSLFYFLSLSSLC